MQAAIGSLSNISIASLKNSLDEVRAQVYPRNETERKVYEALSSKNWGASTTLMNDIAGDTGDYEKFGIIMSLIWSSIETDGKSWKQVFKALTLIEFLVKNGSERVIEACRDKIYKIRSLENFNFYEGTLDRGSGVREKSKQIVELLGSNEMIRTEREKASSLRDKFVGIGNDGSRGSTGSTSAGNSYSGGGGGGGGGGSYGNGGDRGFGSSYSDNNSNSNGGHDSYSSNSNARDGRYTNDSYNSNTGGGSGSGSNGRYRDDEPKYPTETVAAKKKSYDEDEDDVKIKHKTKSTSKLAAPVNDTAVGGKLKLSIKKGSSPAPVSAAPVQQAAMLDFLDSGDSDFMSAPPAPPANSNPNLFEAFSTPASSAQDDFGFASFSAAPSAPQSQAFDPFGMGSPPPQPQVQFSQAQFQQAPAVPQQSFGQFGAMQAPPVPPAPMMQPVLQQQMMSPVIPQQSFGHFNSPMQAPPVPQSSMMQGGMQQHQYQQQQQQPMAGYAAPAVPQSAPAPQQQQQQPVPFRGLVVKAPEPAYGDFEGSTHVAAQAPVGKWGDIGSLVNLGGISKNESLVAKQQMQAAAASNYTPSSFSGLDGFSKSQSMQQSGSPMSMNMGAVRQAPMQQYQQQPQQSAMGAMGGGFGAQGHGQAQFQGYGMPAREGGGMQPNRGAAPQQGQGQYGAPQGQGQGQYGNMGMQQQQQQPNMMMGQSMMGGGMQGGMQGQAPRGMMAPGPTYGYSPQGPTGNYQ